MRAGHDKETNEKASQNRVRKLPEGEDGDFGVTASEETAPTPEGMTRAFTQAVGKRRYIPGQPSSQIANLDAAKFRAERVDQPAVLAVGYVRVIVICALVRVGWMMVLVSSW